MATVSVEAQLSAILSRVEQGETIVVTRDDAPILELVPRPPSRRGGFDLEAREAYLRSTGITRVFPFVAGDFDRPLDEGFLLKPLPK